MTNNHQLFLRYEKRFINTSSENQFDCPFKNPEMCQNFCVQSPLFQGNGLDLSKMRDNEMRYKCDKCEYLTHRPGRLKEHIDVKHLNIGKYTFSFQGWGGGNMGRVHVHLCEIFFNLIQRHLFDNCRVSASIPADVLLKKWEMMQTRLKEPIQKILDL